METLQDWLAHCESLHPKAIEMGLERVQAVVARMGLRFDCPVITVAGTNGKGSTCAMLEAIALHAGYRTGVYTSPHLVHFEERCRIRGEIVTAQALVPHFERVEAARQGVTLTYFEFTTLAIMDLMAASNLDLAILEVGLGGRLDAVNIVDADCAVITSIDLDHMDYLGPDRESIGREKAGIMRTGRPAIVSDPAAPQSVLDRAVTIGADLWTLGRDFNFSGDKQQWAWAGRGRRYSGLAYPALRGARPQARTTLPPMPSPRFPVPGRRPRAIRLRTAVCGHDSWPADPALARQDRTHLHRFGTLFWSRFGGLAFRGLIGRTDTPGDGRSPYDLSDFYAPPQHPAKQHRRGKSAMFARLGRRLRRACGGLTCAGAPPISRRNQPLQPERPRLRFGSAIRQERQP